jgi:hypothetical protein
VSCRHGIGYHHIEYSYCVEVRPATTASATTMASDYVAVHPATAARDCIMVHPNMAAGVVRSNVDKASECVTVCSHKAMIVSAAKTNTKAGQATNEWVNFDPSDEPTNFLMVAPPLPACSCQGCIDMLANFVYTVECYFCETFFGADPKCANMYFDNPHPCHKLCGAYLCDKCHNSEDIVNNRLQCSVYGQHTCHNCMQTMDYLDCWIAIF